MVSQWLLPRTCFFSLSSRTTNKIRIQLYCSAMSVKVWMQLLRNFKSKSLSIDTFSLFQNRTNCTNHKHEHKSWYRVPQMEICSSCLLHEHWPLSGVSRKRTSALLTNTAWKKDIMNACSSWELFFFTILHICHQRSWLNTWIKANFPHLTQHSKMLVKSKTELSPQWHVKTREQSSNHQHFIHNFNVRKEKIINYSWIGLLEKRDQLLINALSFLGDVQI
jgi:hypothetical protein